MTEKVEFIYLYDLSISAFLDYLSENREIVLQHWEYLRNLKNEGYLLFAGSTLDKTYEFIIIRVKDKESAQQLYNTDPFTKSKLFKGQLCSFRASLLSDDDFKETLEKKAQNIDSVYSSETNIYMGTIKGRPTFINDATEEEIKIMGVHFQRLKQSFDEKKLILAGPILEEGMFGLTVFFDKSLEDASYFVKNDPAVVNRVLEPNVHPFRLFLINNK